MIESYISYFEHHYVEKYINSPFQSKLSYEAVLFLEKVKAEFPNNAWPYIKLGEDAFDNHDFYKSLRIYEELFSQKPNSKDALIGIFKSLLSLERFEEAEQFYISEAPKKEAPLLQNKEAFILLNITLQTKKFVKFTSSDFSKLFFMKYIIRDNFWFIVKVCELLIKHSPNDYLLLAQEYVQNNGGRLIYVTIDQLFDVKNKSEAERKLLKEHFWEPEFNRIEWLQNCPEHVRNIFSALPNFSETYIKEIFSGPVNHIQGTKVVMANYSSQFVNVENNMRNTVMQPNTTTRHVHILGGSDVYGFGSEDKDTFASVLQNKFCKNPKTDSIRVENHGIRGNPLPVLVNNLLQQSINAGDIVIIFGYAQLSSLPKCIENFHINLSRPHSYGEVFFDHTHLAFPGNQLVADKLIEHLDLENTSPIVPKEENRVADETASVGIELIKYLLFKKSAEICEVGALKDYIDYLKGHKIDANCIIGSVAVNCNPLTLGHLHLLEYASQKVDKLYIFVIEEDLSFFSFETRFSLVKEGTAHLDNVTVLRGGRYICTEFTYPEYYSKAEITQVIADASMEAWFFCEFIAKELNISRIFLGDEPFCKITKQYNKKMSELLPNYGIDVNIIPRISDGEVLISASVVRQYLKAGNFEAIEKIVPECTYQYLHQEFAQ